jgi:hypothetical protein
MLFLKYFIFFSVLLVALLSALHQMSLALDEANIERFTLWTSIASFIAGLPMMLWQI